MRRKPFWRYVCGGLLGAALGMVSALSMAGLLPWSTGFSNKAVTVGGWSSDFAIGSAAADPYTRALVARYGLLALAREEAVYFTRNRDDAGDPLRADCTYRISGSVMPAQWWSITLYDDQGMLPVNDDMALSFNAGNVAANDWSVVAGPQKPDRGDWISTRGAGAFDLTLRLYLPEARLFENANEVLVPPTVARLGCVGAPA